MVWWSQAAEIGFASLLSDNVSSVIPNTAEQVFYKLHIYLLIVLPLFIHLLLVEAIETVNRAGSTLH